MKWEELCFRCGLCCREKTVTEDYLIFSDSVCSFLDSKTRLCTVYKERFKKCKRCLKVTPLRAMTACFLPPTCAYVMWAKRHHIRFPKTREVVFYDCL